MDVDERQRYHLHQSLERELGSDAAATLMSLLPPVGWADVATKRDLDALEQRLGLRITAEIADVRTEIAAARGELRTEIHKTARAMTFANVGATAAIVTVIAIVTSLLG